MNSKRRFYNLKFTIGKNTFKEFNNLSAKQIQNKIPELFKEHYGFEYSVSYDVIWNMANPKRPRDKLFCMFVKITNQN